MQAPRARRIGLCLVRLKRCRKLARSVAPGASALPHDHRGRIYMVCCGRRKPVPLRKLACANALQAYLLLQLAHVRLGAGDSLARALELLCKPAFAGARIVPFSLQHTQVVHSQKKAQIRKLRGKLLVGMGFLRLALKRP